MVISIHCEPAIEWQPVFAQKMQQGLKAIGINSDISASRWRESDIAILLGTTCWRHIETTGHHLLVDRCSFGDTNENVSLVWNGHGKRGDHCVPEWRNRSTFRLRSKRPTPELLPWRTEYVLKFDDGTEATTSNWSRVVLCGQTETYSPNYKDLDAWYSQVSATHFRKHPAGSNPTGLPLANNWDEAGLVITLNSSVAVESVIEGIPTITMDGASMAFDVTSHIQDRAITPDRRRWLDWLSWTQWHHDEIREGEPIKHLFEGRI